MQAATRLLPRALTAASSLRARLPHASSVFNRTSAAFVAGAFTAMPMLTGEDFFEHKFVTDKDPDAIVDFYSTEDFLQILGVFPLAIHFVLSGVEWDLNKENTMSVYNSMEISFVLQEREEETPEGEKVVAFFQKVERFKNFIPLTRLIMWDQTQCYGYNRREDGTCEVFHRGQTFYGPLIVRLIVQLHARYVIWATERHINSPLFGTSDLEAQEHQRGNIPVHVFSDFLKRLSLGYQVALESGKIAAGSDTAKAEETLKQLKKMQRSDTVAYVESMKKVNLRRQVSSIEVSDPASKAAIDNALAELAKTKEGKAEAAAAMAEVVRATPEVVKEKPRYGGIFRGKKLEGLPS